MHCDLDFMELPFDLIDFIEDSVACFGNPFIPLKGDETMQEVVSEISASQMVDVSEPATLFQE